MKIVLAPLRFFQILFGIVILGISISLARGQVVGHTPATTGYGAFVGAFTIIAGIIGVVAIFATALPEIISWAVDALAALFLLAGGIAFAVGLKGTSCSKVNTALVQNDLLNCGYLGSKKGTNGGPTCTGSNDASKILAAVQSRCRQATADEAFLWMTLVITIAALVVSFLSRGRGSRGYAV